MKQDLYEDMRRLSMFLLAKLGGDITITERELVELDLIGKAIVVSEDPTSRAVRVRLGTDPAALEPDVDPLGFDRLADSLGDSSALAREERLRAATPRDIAEDVRRTLSEVMGAFSVQDVDAAAFSETMRAASLSVEDFDSGGGAP
jgi:hypothetical protein